MKLTLMGLLVLALAACSTTPLKNSRQPSEFVAWNLESLSLASPEASGQCELVPSSLIRRSNIKSNSTLVAGKSVEGCNLNFPSQKTASDGIFIEALYFASSSDRIKMVFTFGDIEYANNESDDAKLTKAGYSDIDLTGNGVYKIKPTQNFEFSGQCQEPQLVGVYGFRKMKVTCTLLNNQGTVVLVKD